TATCATAEWPPPETVVVPVPLPAVPAITARFDGAEIVKSGDGLPGLNTMSSTGCSSTPFGATPVCPWRKSKKPTPLICTAMLAVWNDVVACNCASNFERAAEIADANGLPVPTQLGDGISVIIVLPDAS